MLHPHNHSTPNRVKKPDEFNRPRIPIPQRKVKRKNVYLTKKVNCHPIHSSLPFPSLPFPSYTLRPTCQGDALGTRSSLCLSSLVMLRTCSKDVYGGTLNRHIVESHYTYHVNFVYKRANEVDPGLSSFINRERIVCLDMNKDKL